MAEAKKDEKKGPRYSVKDKLVIDERYGTVVAEGDEVSKVAERMNADADEAASKDTPEQYHPEVIQDKVVDRIPAKSHHNDSETQIRRSMLDKEPNTVPDAEPPEEEEPPPTATIEGAAARDHGARRQPPEPPAQDTRGAPVATKPANNPPRP